MGSWNIIGKGIGCALDSSGDGDGDGDGVEVCSSNSMIETRAANCHHEA